ncbi:MAG: hypothetical protein K2R93_11905 [Gemmatimonadaceae bacterium]|jgi:hypothetical protein|nr:hypothetical protein [Gemmatimonadaceae bacterium]
MHNEQQGTPSESRGSTTSTARASAGYPLGRGYGHDYMRGGEVFGGYGYSDRPEYEQTRGENTSSPGS